MRLWGVCQFSDLGFEMWNILVSRMDIGAREFELGLESESGGNTDLVP